jgi:hypothetical protein
MHQSYAESLGVNLIFILKEKELIELYKKPRLQDRHSFFQKNSNLHVIDIKLFIFESRQMSLKFKI